MRLLKGLAVLGAILVCSGKAGATDRFYRDISTCSPNGQYEVEARSPDNKPGAGFKVFQASFVYTCTDRKTQEVLWTRKQAMEEPQSSGTSGAGYALPKEDSPIEIHVSDGGWTAILTGRYEIIAVNPNGHDTCKIGLWEALSQDEQKKYVHLTTGGPTWAEGSLWYFLNVGKQHLFVVRPWWGRRILADIEKGQLAAETPIITKAIATYERSYVLTQLGTGVKTRIKWEKGESCELVWPVRNAAYLAGTLQIREAIPLLRQLEDSTYSGSNSGRGLSFDERPEGEIAPDSYNTLTLRQTIQFSLRRLGETPRPLSPITFRMEYKDYKKNRTYVAEGPAVPRHTNIDEVQTGMMAMQVLSLLGGPDFVGYNTWEYDMDSVPPITLLIKWDALHVVRIEKKTPPLWKDGFPRDELLAQ